MLNERIPRVLARRMALHGQLLVGDPGLPGGKEGVAQAIEKLGYVQIDTIAVVQRAHHHTLWARRPDYDPQMLHELQAEDRRVFEYWGHAASYLPMSDYRYYLPRMRSYQDPKNKWVRNRLETHGHLLEPVKERIREEGPLGSKDFKPPSGTKRGTWWDWKPSKVALELLLWQGELMITERRNFQRIYDLTERVLPAEVDTRVPGDDELGRFLVRRALSAFGVARERAIRFHLKSAGTGVVEKALAEMVDAGQVVPVKVEGYEDQVCYALPERIEQAVHLEPASDNVLLLSPFDNLVIQRDRIQWLFDYEYTLECYTPREKRRYGYFSLPILWGADLVGRMDSKADRKQKRLIVRGLFFEPGFAAFDAFLEPFVESLAAFATFNECESVRLERVSEESFFEPLRQRLEGIGPG